ncbi:hypothetical protein VTJ04DRAFT_2810 [Mycothermus thermophilus]|uniref:uncharacterized protein n=1 Tax=Humicola insolens TaxID=85995 RepID=UPI003743250B
MRVRDITHITASKIEPFLMGSSRRYIYTYSPCHLPLRSHASALNPHANLLNLYLSSRLPTKMIHLHVTKSSINPSRKRSAL